MNVSIRAMSLSDYPAATALWGLTQGIGLSDSDSQAAVAAFLQRNPDMSAVAVSQSGELVGAVLCGHDGRRGYLHHLAVAAAHRNRGIADGLIGWCFDRLADRDVPKCAIFLFRDNDAGSSFWQHNGWSARADLLVYQKTINPRRQPGA